MKVHDYKLKPRPYTDEAKTLLAKVHKDGPKRAFNIVNDRYKKYAAR